MEFGTELYSIRRESCASPLTDLVFFSFPPLHKAAMMPMSMAARQQMPRTPSKTQSHQSLADDSELSSDGAVVVACISVVCAPWVASTSDLTPLPEEAPVVELSVEGVEDFVGDWPPSMSLRKVPRRPKPRRHPSPPVAATGKVDTDIVPLVVTAMGVAAVLIVVLPSSPSVLPEVATSVALEDAGELLVVSALVTTADLSATRPSAAAPKNSNEEASETAATTVTKK